MEEVGGKTTAVFTSEVETAARAADGSRRWGRAGGELAVGSPSTACARTDGGPMSPSRKIVVV